MSPSEVILFWAAQKVGHTVQTLTDLTLRTPDAIFGRQLAMMAMTYAKMTSKEIALALGTSALSIRVKRHKINGRRQSCLYQQAAALGKSLKARTSPPRTNSPKPQNSAAGQSSPSPTCQTARPGG